MFQHQCIKPGCENTYQDTDEDAYYCSSCNSVRQQIIKEMDGKFNTVGQESSGILAAYDAARGNNKFPSAAALGIKI